MRASCVFVFLFSLMSGVTSIAKPLETVSRVELTRYMGKWYEIARLPFKQQEGCFGSLANYTLMPDGKVQVINSCYDKSFEGKIRSVKGKAKVVDKKTNAKLKVQFFWPFWGDYWVISLDENYEYAVVGEPKRDNLWVLSRKPILDEKILQQLLEDAEDNGYDLSQLERTPQKP